MENTDEKRQIAVNLEHNADGTTLHTHVHSVLQTESEHIAQNATTESLEVTDTGWDTDQIRPKDYAIDGVRNEDAWLLVRRFNKVGNPNYYLKQEAKWLQRVFHLKHFPSYPEDELDLNVAEDEQFSPNKLRAQLERLYMEAILGFIMFRQHLSRLQSWREPRRTASFCIAYFTAWYLNFLMPTFLAALLSILLSPRIRDTLFPPCPPSLVHYQGGHLIKPAAGVLGTTDSATGAPENLKGETLEREASNFATGLVALSINIFVDKDPQHDESQRGGCKTANLPDPRSMATRITTAKDKAAGVDNPSWDKTKSPMQELMWSQMRPLMHWICRFCDIWERSAKIAFKGIPTDSQLTITLLRQAERNKTPLPPPPAHKGPPPEEPHIVDDTIVGSSNNDSPLGATPAEINAAVQRDPSLIRNTGGDDHESSKSGTGGKKRGKLLSVVKPVAQAAAKTLIHIDKVRAKTGSESAKNRVGAASPREEPPVAGPVEFTCRYRGERGFVYLTTDSVSPALCFCKKTPAAPNVENSPAQPDWIIPVSEIVTLNKYSGYGAKAKLLAGWALEDEIADGLEVVDGMGRAFLVTALTRRDELFNRLCAVGDQRWEIW
ncbi:hypothetical protein NW768_011518 [Fusarium equiseti]|uniref:Uncharacterized protein n=1 Tax=Fusarium equiseti TaxID=61235 RepID=A0ABQ8QWT2_FUSEQ|nr:hypothetical protein NW768_011518 [Fusarium equiseti]